MEPFDPAKYFHIEVSEGIFTDIYLLHKLDYILVHVMITPPAFADNLRYQFNSDNHGCSFLLLWDLVMLSAQSGVHVQVGLQITKFKKNPNELVFFL